MNSYKITFTRENGTTGSGIFTAACEAQARRDFKEVYRHGNGTITSVELISTDFSTAKEPACAELYRDAAVRYASNACDAHKAQRAAEERIAELEAEVNRLKAKLYDYMVKEAIQ